jgi:hypothetical protein
MVELYRQENPDSSTRALCKYCQQSDLAAKQEKLAKEMINLTLRSFSKGNLTCRKILRHGSTDLLPLRRKACCGFLSPLQIHCSWTGSNPRTLGPLASTITITPPRTISHLYSLGLLAYKYKLMCDSLLFNTWFYTVQFLPYTLSLKIRIK